MLRPGAYRHVGEGWRLTAMISQQLNIQISKAEEVIFLSKLSWVTKSVLAGTANPSHLFLSGYITADYTMFFQSFS